MNISGLLSDSYYDYRNSNYPSNTLIINGNGFTIHSDNRYDYLDEKYDNVTDQRFLQIFDGKHVFLNNLNLHGFGLKTGQYHGGLIWMTDNSYLDMNNCHIYNNDVGCQGMGVITLHGTSHLKMINSSIETTYIWGGLSKSGGVYIESKNAEAMLYNCTFKDIGTDKKNAHWGGAIFTYGKLICEGCTFDNVKAKCGAAVYIQEDDKEVRLENCNFINCKASDNGIVYLCNKVTNAKLIKCRFINNLVLAKKQSALIYLDDKNQNIKVQKCIFYSSKDSSRTIVARIADNSQKDLFDNCFRYNYKTVGNVPGGWEDHWLNQQIEGETNVHLYDTKTYTLVLKDTKNHIIDDMPDCPPLLVDVIVNHKLVFHTDIAPKNKNNKGTFEVTFNNLNEHYFYCSDPILPDRVVRKTVKVGDGYVSLDTTLKKGVVNEFINKVDLSLNFYYNNNKNSPFKNKPVYYSIDNGHKFQIKTNDKGHIDLHLDNLTGNHKITFSTNSENHIKPLNEEYTIFVKTGTSFFDVKITSTDNNFNISGKLVDKSGTGLSGGLIFIEINRIKGGNLIRANTTSGQQGLFDYNYGSKLLPGTYLVSLTYKGDNNYAGTSYNSQIIIGGTSTVLHVPEVINGSLDSVVLIPATLTVNDTNHNLTNGVWLYTTQDWYYKFISGSCTFNEIQWYNNADLTPVGLNYTNGINLGFYGSNVSMDFSVFPSFGTYYAFFIVLEDETFDSSDAFNISCLEVKVDSDMKVIPNATSIYSGENVTIEISIKDKFGIEGATGQADIYVNDIFVQSVNLIEGSASAVLKDFKIGDNKVKVKYLGDDNFLPAEKSVNINVKKKDLNFDVLINDVTYGFMVVAYMDGLPDDFNGTIQFVISKNGATVLNRNFDPNYRYELGRDYEIGDYNVSVKASGDNRYNDKTVNTTFNVDKRGTVVEIDVPDYIKKGNDITVKFNVLPSSATGTVTISLTDRARNVIYNKTVDVKAKSVKIDKSYVAVDESYKIVVEYSGDNHHYSSVAEDDLTVVSKDITQISAAVDDFYYLNEPVVIEFSVNVVDYLNPDYSSPVYEGTVTVRLYYDDEDTMVLEKTVDVAAGKVDLGFLNASAYKVYLTYNGNENYLNSSNFYYFDVGKFDSDIDVSVRYDSNDITTLSIYVTPIDATGSYTLLINNQEYGSYDVSVHEIVLNNLPGGFYDVIIYYEGDSKYEASSAVTNFTTRYNPSINIAVSYDSDNGIFTVVTILPNDATGEYLLYADEQIVGTFSVDDKNIKIPGLGEGNHSFTVYYKGDSNYKPGTNTTVFTTENSSFVKLNAVYDDKTGIAILNIQVLPLYATGEYTVFLNGEAYGTFDVSVNKITLNDLKEGEYTVEVMYWGDDVYNPSYTYDILTVNIGLELIPLDSPFITFADDLKPYRVLVNYDNKPFSGAVVKFTIDGMTYSRIADDEGIAELPIDLAPGDYVIVVSSGGAVFNDTIYVVERGLDLVPLETPFSIFCGDLKPYRVLVTDEKVPLSGILVKFTVNGVTYSKITDDEGIAELPIDLTSGVYKIMISSGGVVINDTIKVKSTIDGQDLVKYYLNDTQFYATFLDSDGKPLADSEVMFKINGISYYRYTNAQGVAKFSINLNPGDYIITAVNPVNQEEKSFNVKVLHTVVGKDLVMYFRDGSRYECIAVDDHGNPLSGVHLIYNIHGIFYEKVTDENGVAGLKINLNPGEYIVTVLNPVTGECFSNLVTVQHTINSKDLTMRYKDGSKFECKVVDFEGNPWKGLNLLYNINGVFYNKITDENGVAGLAINLNPGEYIITVYNTVTDEALSNTITVLPVLIGSDVEMFYNDGTCYECLLVDSENQPVPDEFIMINLNGAIYYLRTDIRGTVSLPIDLQPGEYIVTARHDDATASNKITVYP